jgi:hypothetical protein
VVSAIHPTAHIYVLMIIDHCALFDASRLNVWNKMYETLKVLSKKYLGTNWTKAKWEGEAERKCKVGKAFEI